MTTTCWLLVLSLVSGLDGGQAPDAGVAAAEERRAAPDGGASLGPAKPPMLPEVKALVDRMQAFYELTKDFTAGFRQDYTYAASKRATSSSGTVTYKKPAQMRWEYAQPSPRTFVLAGDRVYMYDPEAKLVTRAALASNQLSASVTFLWGQGKLAEEFAIAKKPCPECEAVSPDHPRRSFLLELVPLKPDPRLKKVLLEVDRATAQVLKSTVVDPDGSVNAISFLDLKTNTGVEEKAFRLTPPPGTQVQDFLGPDAGSK